MATRRYIVRTDFSFAGCFVDSEAFELDDSEILDATGEVDGDLANTVALSYQEEVIAGYISSELIPVDENGEPCEEGENIVEEESDYDEPELDDEEALASAGRGLDESYGYYGDDD